MAAAPAAGAAVSAAQLLYKTNLPAQAGRVLLYDGVCNLCNSSLKFIAKRDPNKNIMFCSIQSLSAQPYLQVAGMTRQEALRRLLFVEYKDVAEGSTAVLRVAGYMQQPWPMARVLLVVPEPARDSLFGLVTKNRYRWFGRTLTCQVPDTELLDRFVDRDELLAGTCTSEAMDEDDVGHSRKDRNDKQA